VDLFQIERSVRPPRRSGSANGDLRSQDEVGDNSDTNSVFFEETERTMNSSGCLAKPTRTEQKKGHLLWLCDL